MPRPSSNPPSPGLSVACSRCDLRELCLPVGLDAGEPDCKTALSMAGEIIGLDRRTRDSHTAMRSRWKGLKLETVSRTFSKFADDGLIEVAIPRILDADSLQWLVNEPRGCGTV